MRKLCVSVLIVCAAVWAFAAIPQNTSSVAIDGLKLTGESTAAIVAEGTCPIKSNHTSCQQAVNTGAFGAIPAPVLAEGTCPVKSQHNCCQQNVNTGAFGTCPAPQVATL
jgi:hypothetical protein